MQNTELKPPFLLFAFINIPAKHQEKNFSPHSWPVVCIYVVENRSHPTEKGNHFEILKNRNALWWPRGVGWPRREAYEGGDIYIYIYVYTHTHTHTHIYIHIQLIWLPRWLSDKKKIHLPMQEMQETWVWSLNWEDPLEEEIATHSSIHVWKIPWTEEPGGLQSMGSQSQTWLSNWAQLNAARSSSGGRGGLSGASRACLWCPLKSESFSSLWDGEKVSHRESACRLEDARQAVGRVKTGWQESSSLGTKHPESAYLND